MVQQSDNANYLTQYIQDAIRTESHIEVVHTEYDKLLQVMQLFIAAGNMLDAIKKNVFYGKNINNTIWNFHLGQVINMHTALVADNRPMDAVDLPIDPRLFHALLGIATESTELIEAIAIAIQNGTDIDHFNVCEELGDLNWYQAIAIDATKANWRNILETNIQKLQARYPDKFTAEAATHRDLITERAILETHHIGNTN